MRNVIKLKLVENEERVNYANSDDDGLTIKEEFKEESSDEIMDYIQDSLEVTVEERGNPLEVGTDSDKKKSSTKIPHETLFKCLHCKGF